MSLADSFFNGHILDMETVTVCQRYYSICNAAHGSSGRNNDAFCVLSCFRCYFFVLLLFDWMMTCLLCVGGWRVGCLAGGGLEVES